MRGCTQASHMAQCVRPMHSCIVTALAATPLFNLGQGLAPSAPGGWMPRACIRRARAVRWCYATMTGSPNLVVFCI